MASFLLDPRLAADSVRVAPLGLCDLRLMNDARFPWLLLVPRVAGAAELIDLPPGVQSSLLSEVAATAAALRDLTGCDKLNVAALGNVVRQPRDVQESGAAATVPTGVAQPEPAVELSAAETAGQAVLSRPAAAGGGRRRPALIGRMPGYHRRPRSTAGPRIPPRGRAIGERPQPGFAGCAASLRPFG